MWVAGTPVRRAGRDLVMAAPGRLLRNGVG
jgi:hypothetical protein